MATGFGDSITQAVTRMGVVQGEIDNVVGAAIRDIGENVVQTMSGSWPLGERRIPSQAGIHSADRWEMRDVRKLAVEIHNSAPYAAFVHHEPQFGGPPGLADRVVPDLVQQAEADPLAFMSERVLALLGGV